MSGKITRYKISADESAESLARVRANRLLRRMGFQQIEARQAPGLPARRHRAAQAARGM